MGQRVDDSRTGVDHGSGGESGDTIGKKCRCKCLRSHSRACRCGCCCGGHQDTGQRSEDKCGHVHCFKNVGHVVLQGGCFDDPCDGSCSDQKDGDADDFGETEFGVLDEFFSLSGRNCADGTADRKRDERINCDAGDRTESQHDDNDSRSEYCGKEAREIFAAGTFKIRSLNLFTLLLYEDGGEYDCYSECADGGNDVAGHDGCQRLFKCF